VFVVGFPLIGFRSIFNVSYFEDFMLENSCGTLNLENISPIDLTELQLTQHLCGQLISGLPEILIVLDHDGTIKFASGQLASHVKISAADIVGKSAWQFIHPDDIGDAVNSLAYAQTTEGRTVGPFVFRYFDRNGQVRTADAVAVTRKDNEVLSGTVMLLRDVVGERSLERALECLANGYDLEVIACHLLRAVEETPITGPGWLLRSPRPNGGVTNCPLKLPEVVALSPAAESVGDLAALVGDWIFDPNAETPIVDPDLSTVEPALRSALHRIGIHSLMAMPVRTPGVTRPDLWLIACNRRQAPATANELRTIQRYASVLSVASERLRLQAELRHAAIYDRLTGLPNRAAFMARLSEAQPGLYALLFLDLNGFKPINDCLGHSAGDEVLVEVGRRLKATVRANEFVARLGGDEFGVLVPERPSERASVLAEEIVQAVARPIGIGEKYVDVGVSIGIAIGPAEKLEALLDQADSAMYQAKSECGQGAWRLAGRGERRFAERRSAARSLG
jgi:diguanylate cyclase (GGDEF)-like protein/PAS domain S-box-containing protein